MGTGESAPTESRTIRTSKGLREYTCLGCPLTRNRTTWCFRLCEPDAEGKGRCGRIAPHSLRGRTDLSIERFNEAEREAHYERLEQQYLTAPHNEFLDAGVRILHGEAEIVIPVQDRFLDLTGKVHPSVCFTAMADSAALAICSFVRKSLVTVVDFDTELAIRVASGELMARSRYVGISGKHYLAESVLFNSEGQEVGKGKGTFVESDAPPAG
jgi:acyl-coenzyme A thioesterase PaaI-like protein